MSWTASTPISLGTSNTGLASTLKFALARGATIDATLRDLTSATTGVVLVERGRGVYSWSYTAMPDGFAGDVVFYTGTLASASNLSGVTFKAQASFGSSDEAAAKALSRDDGLLASFGFDESGGNPISSVGSYTMTLAGAAIRVEPAGNFGAANPLRWAGRAMQFASGTSDYGTIPGLLATPPANGFIAFWFKPIADVASNARLFTLWNSASGTYYGLDCYVNVGGDARISVRRYTGTLTPAAVLNTKHGTPYGGKFVAGRQYHLIYSWGSQGSYLAINGAIEDRDTDTGAWGAGTTAPFTISAYNNGSTQLYGNIVVDDFQVGAYQPNHGQRVAMFNRSTATGRAGEYDKWTPVAGNPILSTASTWALRVLEPRTRTRDGSNFKHWFTGGSDASGQWSIGYATSTDGFTWSVYGSTQVLGNGVGGESDNANCGSIYDDGTTYHLHYVNGYNPSGMNLCYATSTDGHTWTKQGVALAANALASIGCLGFAGRDIILHNGVYWMLCGVCLNNGAGPWGTVLLSAPAISGPWTLAADTPLYSLQTGDGSFSAQRVLKIGGLFHAWAHNSDSLYFPTNGYRFVSGDLVHWEPYAGNPVLELNDFGAIPTQDQVGDIDICPLPQGGVYCYFDVDGNTTSPLQSKICGAKYAGNLNQLVHDDGETLLSAWDGGAKAGDVMALTPDSNTAIAADVQAGLTAQGLSPSEIASLAKTGDAMTLTGGTITSIQSAILNAIGALAATAGLIPKILKAALRGDKPNKPNQQQ